MCKCPYPSPASQWQYVIFNVQTGYVLRLGNNLKEMTRFWHKVPKRKYSTLVLCSNYTGEIIKQK